MSSDWIVAISCVLDSSPLTRFNVSPPLITPASNTISRYLEDTTQSIVSKHVQQSLNKFPLHVKPIRSPSTNLAVLSYAPVRIDLAGGWSDTPPICYDLGGAVSSMHVHNVLIQLNDQSAI